MCSISVVAADGPCCQHHLGGRHRRLQLRWWPLPDLAASTPMGPTINVFNFGGDRYRTLPPAPPRGPAIDVFNFDGGRCRTLPPATPRAPPSTSSTLVVAAAGHCRQHHPGDQPSTSSTSVVAATRPCRQHPPGGPPSTFSTSVVAAAGTCRQHPQGACYRCLQLQRWPLLDLPPAPSRGPAIDVFNFGGGRYRTCRQHPLGGSPSMSPTSEPPALAPPRGLPSTFLSVDGGRSWTSNSGTSRGPPSIAE
jgi:hypothetical protein